MVIEMELTKDYDESDPYIYEKLFNVSEDIDTLKLDASYQMKGDSGVLEIVDKETEEILWSNSWQGDINKTEFNIQLNKLEKGKEYIIRFTGTKIIYTKIVLTCENSLIKEQEKPIKAKKD